MEQGLMTLKEIAQKLGLPESTLRKYRDAYPQFMPYVGSGREKRYKEVAIEVFNAIREYRMDRHLSWEDTEKELTDRFPINPEALGEKAVVGEEEANIFLERLEKWVKQLSSQAERQEFVSSTLATELVKVRQLAAKLDPISEDVKAVRKSTYNYNEVVQRQYKEMHRDFQKIMEMMATLQGAIHYIPKEFERKLQPAAVSAVAPAAPPVAAPRPAEPVSESALVARLREDVKQKESEVEKFKDLYVRAKREIERLRAELKKQTLDELYRPANKAEAESPRAAQPEQKPAKGGKFLFGRKK
jgi:DNA-binding transcriptional MerR regulator